MSFDLIYAYKPGFAESQIGEGRVNAIDNCVPTSFADVLMAYGYRDVEPQNWTTFEYGADYHGATSYEAAIDFMRRHPEQFPNPPSMRVINPRDTVGEIDAAGQRRYPVIVQFSCDPQAHLVPHYTGIFHVSPAVAFDGSALTILNVWHGELVRVPRAEFEQATADPAGWMVIFEWPLGPKPVTPPPSPPAPDAVRWGAFRGTVMVQKAHTRGAPGLEAPPLRDLVYGTPLDVDGYVHHGPGIPDVKTCQLDDRWFHISPGWGDHQGGWVASTIVDGNPKF